MVLAAMIWGLSFSAQKSSASLPPFTIGATRSFIASIFLVFVIMVFDKATKNGRRLFSKEKPIDFNRFELIGGAICGAILAFATFFQQTGINAGTDAGKSAFITALYVVLVPIYALFLKKSVPANVWGGIIIAVVGFYFLCIDGEFSIAASDVYVIICALIFPIHILAIDKFSPKCDGIRMSCIQFIVCGIISLILALIAERPFDTSEILSCIGPLLFLGIGSCGIAYTLQIIGQRNVNPATASIILSLESVFGVVGSAIVHSETMSTREYIGCIVVFAAVILSQLDFENFKKRKNQ